MSKGVSPSGFISISKLQQSENGKRHTVRNAKNLDFYNLIFLSDSCGSCAPMPLVL